MVGEVPAMRLAATTLAITLSCVTVACGGGSPAEDVCDAACECGACDDAARDRCVDQLEGAREQADEAGCGGELDDYLECVASADGLCQDPELGSVCPDERSDVEACANGS